MPGNNAARADAVLASPPPWASLGVATGAALVTAITPMLFASMVLEGRMLTAQIGQAATCELIGLALTTGLAGVFLGVERLRLKIALAAVTFTLANGVSVFVDYPGILVARFVAGVCEGIFVWQLMQVFARSPRPARLQGLYLGLEGTLALFLSSIYSAYIVPAYGARGGFIGMVIASLFLVALCIKLPRSLDPLPRHPDGSNGPSLRALIGLAGVFLSFAGILAIWVHLPSLAVQQRQPAAAIGFAVALALVFEVVGGLTAAALDSRFSSRATLLICWALLAMLPLAWTLTPSPWMFAVFGALFGFLWMFHLPYSVSFIVELDPTRRSLPFLPTAQPLGAGAGPLLASLAVVGTDVRGALLVGTALLCAAVAPVLFDTLKRRQRAPATLSVSAGASG